MLFCMLECFLHFMQAKQGLPYVHSALLLLTAIAQSEKVWWVGEGQWVEVGGWGWRRRWVGGWRGFCSWVLDCCFFSHLRHEYVRTYMSSTGKGLF